MKQYYTYIVASKTGTLYTGMTNDLERRVYEHKNKTARGFTKKYNISRLVWHEEFHDVNEAISAEKVIKGWRRSKKVELIEEKNLEWIDLAADWFDE